MEKNNNWTQTLKEAHRASLFQGVEELYPTLIPDLIYQKILLENKNGPLSLQFLPQDIELETSGFSDPIGDQVHQKTSMLIHRYKNRALFIPTTKCPINCRYCFRKNELQTSEVFSPDWEETINYLDLHTEIEEIIFTGGDPFILSDEKINYYLNAFSQIPHIKWIRFHTRTPIVMPERLTADLKNTLLKYTDSFHKIIIVLHTNHEDEVTSVFEKKLKDFLDPKIPWLSQSVLLKGVNDDADVLRNLFFKLSSLSIAPYYLHHPDQVKGAMHFYLSIEEGRRIYAKLRDLLPGWLIPQYVVDIQGGFGKVQAYNPETTKFGQSLLDRSGQNRAHQE